ncbi:MAG TPA: DUF72 domain-containing protein [Opitutaceae bacterium]
MPDVRIGISGWRYPPWRGVFYPRNLPQRRELEYASRQVSSIEINGSFYSLQRPEYYQAWAADTPEDFLFAVKGPRFITHQKRLRDIETPLANFFASGVLRLGARLGPVLWQLPPSMKFDAARLSRFFDLLPRDTSAAAALARRHDERLRGRASTRTDRTRPLRHALEVRHPTFESAAFVQLLRHYKVALVVADTAGRWPLMEDVTADFIYVRLHGDVQLYTSGYTPEALDEWARKLRAWTKGGNPRGSKLHAPPAPKSARGRDAYVYFDNDVKVRAPFDAMNLAHRLGLSEALPEKPPDMKTIAEEPRTRWPGFRAPKPRRRLRTRRAAAL